MSTEAVLHTSPRARLVHGTHERPVRRRYTAVGAHTSTAVRPTHDRILRYPDGAVRTIRYPDSVQQQSTPQSVSTTESLTSDWHICGENDSGCAFDPNFDDECSLPGAAPVEQLWGTAAPGTTKPAEKESQLRDEFDQLPSSPAALLEFLASDEYMQAQQAQTARIKQSFKVLHGCPWVAQRPLLTVVVPQRGKDEPAAYTLPVAVEQDGQSMELAKLVGSPSLARKLTHRHMQDGIIAFANAHAAMRFRDELQTSGTLAAALTEVDSHTLFRASADAKHVVVLVGPDSTDDTASALPAIARGTHLDSSDSSEAKDVFVPTPAELAAALRGASPMQDW